MSNWDNGGWRHDNSVLKDRGYLKEIEFQKKFQVQCECGKKRYIHNDQDYVICTWCGKKIYRKGKARFDYEMNKRLNNE